MKNLRGFTLTYDEKRSDWELTNNLTNRVVKRFEDKQDATERGVLKGILGSEGGSVRIQKMNGVYEEERTYPKSRDPKSSKG